MPDILKRLADKSRIQDELLRYCRGVDRRDRELVLATFFEHCYHDHAEFNGKRDDLPINGLLSNHHSSKV